LSDKQMNNHKQKATIVSIDHLNKSFEVKITKSPETDYSDSYSYVQLLLPKDQVGNYFEVGDVI